MINPTRYAVFHGGVNSAGADTFGCCVQIPAGLNWTPGASFTVETWVRWEGTGGVQVLISKPLRKSRDHVGAGFLLQLVNGVPSLRLPTASGVRTVDCRRETQVRAWTWTHVAATYDGRQAVLYVNGNEAGRGTWPDAAPVPGSDTPLMLGGEFEVLDDRAPLADTVRSRSLPGGMSDARVWTTVVPVEVIQRWSGHENLDEHPQRYSLLGQWRMDEGTGLTVYDHYNRKWDGIFLFANDWLDTNPWNVERSASGALKPGAAPTGNVDLASGRVAFTLPLLGVAELRGVGAQVTLQYRSAVEGSVDTWNLEAPTGLVGLGWTLSGEKIVRDPRGDGAKDNDTFMLLTAEGAVPLVYGGADPEGEIYFARSSPYWKIRYRPQFELWVVIREDGSRTFYGGSTNTPFQSHDAVEWSVAWGNWLGASTYSTAQRRYASAWHRSCQENLQLDRVLYLYEQTQRPLGAAGPERQSFTVSCRLRQIVGPHQDRVDLKYQEKTPEEYQRWDAYPGIEAGADGHQDRLETHYLAALESYSERGTLRRRVELRYGSVGAGVLRKRLLKEVQSLNAAGKAQDAGHSFTYFGEGGGDGVSAALNGPGHLFEASNGALYGALRSHRVPDGATTSYRYARLNLDGAARDVQILPPSNLWGSPRTYFGPDYVAVLWCGINGNNGKMYLRVYTWTGKWTVTDLGVVPVVHGVPALVETRGEFFAVITYGQPSQLQLYSRNPVRAGEWQKHEQTPGGTSIVTAVGDRFLAWLDQTNGHLTRFSRDGAGWKQTTVDLQVGADNKFAIAAEGDTLCTVSATPTNSFMPELCVHRLDRAGNWLLKRQNLPCAYGPARETRSDVVIRTDYSGIKELSIRMGKGFVVAQSYFTEYTASWISSGSYLERFPFFVHRWDESGTLIQSDQLQPQLWRNGESTYRPRLLVVGDTVLVDYDHSNIRYVYQFSGHCFHGITYTHDSLNNNYLGIDSFSTTHNGSAQFYEWNPALTRWDAAMPGYADGNRTLWEKVWSYIYLAEVVLTLPLDWEIALPMDLAFLFGDLLANQLGNAPLAASRANRFFAAGNQLYYRQPSAAWMPLGQLVAEYSGRVVGEWHESLKLVTHSTQAAADFVIYTSELDRTKEWTTQQGKEPPVTHVAHAPGFPQVRQEVRLLKNGGIFGQPYSLPDGESLIRHNGDATELVGPSAFVTYRGNSLGDSSSLRLYRVVNGAFTGQQEYFVTASEAVDDGGGALFTHYRFEAGVPHPSGEGVLFGKSNVLYSGTSSTPDTRNGGAEYYFYTGGDAPLAPSESNAAQFPALVLGNPYYARTLRNNNGTLVEDSSQRLSWTVKRVTLTGQEYAYLTQLTAQENVTDGQRHLVRSTYADEDRGLVTTVADVNVNLAGTEQARVTRYRYAWRSFPELERQNVLTAVAETRVTVNQQLVDATGTQWSQLGPEIPNDPNKWVGLRYPVWGPRNAFQARAASAPALVPTQAPPAEHWLCTQRAKGPMPTGIVAETADVAGVVSSTIYDTRYRNPVASILGASVAEGQAGYLGFSQYERRDGWQITGTDEPSRKGYVGPGGVTGNQASVRAAKYAPRAGVSYVVGAWIQMRAGGLGAKLGFGTKFRAVLPSTAWRYVEFTVPAATADAPPFIQCDGIIDCVYFGPADAALSAAVYDPDYGLVTSQMDGHGNLKRYLYDAHQNLSAEIASEEHPLRLHAYRSSSGLARALRGELLTPAARTELTPGVRLTVTCQDSGFYSCPEWRPFFGQEFLQLLPDVLSAPGRAAGVATPTGTALRFTWRSVAGARLQVLSGTAKVEIEIGKVQVTDQSGRSSEFLGAPGSDDFMVVIIGTRLLLFAGARLLVSQDVTGCGGASFRAAPGGTVPTEVRDVCAVYSPALSLSYVDGLGREIQTQELHPNGTGLVATQTLYDGWGQAAVHTKPIAIGWAPEYQPGLCTAYDWTTGQLTGAVSLYYRNAPETAADRDEAYYACSRQVVEPSPLARAVELSTPGKSFAPGSGRSMRTDFNRNAEARWLFDRVRLPQTDAFRSITRYLPLAPGVISPNVEIFDRAGNLVASALGLDPERTAVSYLQQPVGDGSSTVISPPNLQRNGPPAPAAPGAITAHHNFVGQDDRHQDIDSGATQRLFDSQGRLRLYLDAVGAEHSPPRMGYLLYDAVGRLVEQGRFDQAWVPGELLRRADADRAWPSRETGAVWATRWLYDADGAGETAQSNGRLRETQAQGADDQVVTDRYSYDNRGRMIRVEQRVPGFDNVARVTQYEYDGIDRVSTIRYPGAPRAVTYTYNAAGRLWRVGAGDQPARYAEYEYNTDGSLATEYLNNRRFQGRYRYDLHGHLLNVEYTGPGAARYYQAALEYGIGNTGTAISAITYGTSMATPRGYRYRYVYNSLNRLIQAVTEGGPDVQPNSRWDLTGITGPWVDIDPNGNLQARKEGGQVYTPSYAPQPNRLASMSLWNTPPQVLEYDANGRVRNFGDVRNFVYSGTRVVPDSVTAYGRALQFTYNSAGRRVLKQSGPRKRLYVHGRSDLPLAEFTDNAAEETQYILGLSGLVAYERGGKTYFVIRDHLGSTRLIVDGDGNHTAHFNYLPYGNVLLENSTSTKEAPIAYLFTGQEFDYELNCYNYKARFYDPNLGRFYCPDPAGQWFSPYSYVGSNPINRVDPSGLSAVDWARVGLGLGYTAVLAGLGAAVGASIAAIGNAGWQKGWDANKFASWGAVIGGSLGALRGLADLGVGAWRATRTAAPGAQFPLVVYYEGQRIAGLPTGRAGAEMLAEGAGIPRSHWGRHLVSSDLLARAGCQWPQGAAFNGRLIVVGHGAAGFDHVELGLIPGAHPFNSALQLERFIPGHLNVTRVDLSVCYAGSSGLQREVGVAFGDRLRRGGLPLVGPVPVRGAAGTVSPVGPWSTMGQVREMNEAKNAIGMIFGLPLGRRVF